MLDHTHDAAALSWVASANDPATDFPLQNLPFCNGKSVAGSLAEATQDWAAASWVWSMWLML